MKACLLGEGGSHNACLAANATNIPKAAAICKIEQGRVTERNYSISVELTLFGYYRIRHLYPSVSVCLHNVATTVYVFILI